MFAAALPPRLDGEEEPGATAVLVTVLTAVPVLVDEAGDEDDDVIAVLVTVLTAVTVLVDEADELLLLPPSWSVPLPEGALPPPVIDAASIVLVGPVMV